MHDVAVTKTVHCRIQFRFLPDDCRPAYVVRHQGVTLIAVDPRSTRAEVFDWVPCYLLTQERDAVRRAYGQPPVGRPMPLATEGHLPIPTIVPELLQMPGGPLHDLERGSVLF